MENTFELRYNLTGSDRKRLVTAMAEATGCAAKYKGSPTFAYEVDYFTIDKNGTISFDDRADSEEIEKLIERLHEQARNLRLDQGGVTRCDFNCHVNVLLRQGISFDEPVSPGQ